MPKSSTAASRPSRTSRLPLETSPWNHTGARSQRLAMASAQTRSTASRGISAPSAAIASMGLVRVGGQRGAAEAAVLAGLRPAGRVDAAEGGEEPGQGRREGAQVGDRRVRRDLALEPAVHRPRVREAGVGLARGHRGRDRQRQLRREHGSQRCSLATCFAYQLPLGSRTLSSEPSRNVRLSQPSNSTAAIGRSDHCGNWASTSRRASAASITRSGVPASAARCRAAARRRPRGSGRAARARAGGGPRPTPARPPWA